MAAPRTAQAQVQPPSTQSAGSKLFGVYLAGRQAQQMRDFSAAASAYEKAIAADPESPELITRTFLMEVCVGNFDRAKALAPKVLKLDPSDAVAMLVLMIDRVKAGDTAGAVSSGRSHWPGRAWLRATLPAPTRRCRGSTNSTASSR
jgi:tetratricopeptide (TPR) repeat protein